MENRKYLKVIIILMVVFLLIPVQSSAYDVSTHALITKKIIQEYEAIHGDTFTSTQESIIINGVKDEDELTTEFVEVESGYTSRRPLNHFYNPQNGNGLNARIGTWWTFGTKFKGMASIDWATDTIAQAEYGAENDHTYNDKLFDSGSDFSWDRAIYEYVYGDKKRALKTLGHILHLVEDLTVPEHVRNDPHPPNVDGEKSPYEAYTKGRAPTYDTINTIPISSSLKGLMYELALFTNTYFLSKDTIFTDFDLPKREGLTLMRSTSDGAGQYFGISDYGELVRIRQEKTWSQIGIKESYYLTDVNNKILANYYSHLSQKASEYGVATIELFFKDIEQERKVQSLRYMNKSRGEIESIASTIKNFKRGRFLIASSMSSVDVYELNEEDWEGARRAAKLYRIKFPTRPEGVSVLDESDSDELLTPNTLHPPTPKQIQDYEILPTIIRGTESGVNEILNPGDPNYPDYEQMGAVLLSLESILQELMLKFQKPDKCANKDLSIFKISTCVDPFDEGGLAFGAGGGGLVCPSGNMAPLPDGSLGCAPDIGDIPPPIFCFGGFCINEN